MLRVAERVSHSTGAAAVVSPAPETVNLLDLQDVPICA